MLCRTKSSHRSLLAASAIGIAAIAAPVTGQVITQDLKLLGTDGAVNDQFGMSVAIEGGVVAVAAFFDDDNGIDSGSVYLYTTGGAPIAKVLPPDGASSDWFGHSIAIDGSTLVVGSRRDGDNGADSGSAYLFTTAGAGISKLIANDGTLGDGFGGSVAMSGGIVAIGASTDDENGVRAGSAYLFQAVTGNQLFKLLPSDAAALDQFGWDIDISNGIVVTGAHRSGDNGDNSGSAYLFDAVTGTQLFKLLPDDGAAGDEFGWAVAIENGIVAVGSRGNNNSNGNFAGAVYLFDAITGTQTAKIIAGDGQSSDNFGSSLAIDNGMLAVGATGDDDNGFSSGSVYLFDTASGVQLAKLLSSDGSLNDFFGHSVAIDNGTAIVGAIFDDDLGTSSGSAYLFTAPGPECVADVNGDGMLTAGDFTAWIAAFNAGAPECDQNDDGSCTPADFTAWIANYNAGC